MWIHLSNVLEATIIIWFLDCVEEYRCFGFGDPSLVFMYIIIDKQNDTVNC